MTLAAACGQYECFKLLLSLTTLQPVLAKHPTLLHVIVEAALCNEGTDSSYDILQLLFEEKRELFDRMMSSSTHPTVLELAIWCGRVMVSGIQCCVYVKGSSSCSLFKEYFPSVIFTHCFITVDELRSFSVLFAGFPASEINQTLCLRLKSLSLQCLI